jgi:predicted MFS family arabinose efflux permease
MANTQTPKPFPWLGLVILSAAIFTSVTSEFLPTGLLPDMADELNVSESQVGLLITIFAGTVVLSAAPLTALTRGYSRKSLVIVVLLVFVIANLLAAIAPNYAVLAIARVLGGLAHGLFWAVVGAYSGYLVPKHQIGRAVAITSGGATAAFVLGVPLGTALGHALGWRMAFAVIGMIVVVLIVAVARFLPAVSHGVQLRTGEIAVPMRKDPTVPGVIIICVITIVVMIGHNTFYTYIAPYLVEVVGFEPDAIAMLLFVYGGAGAIGLVVAGLVSDRYPRAGLLGAVALVAASVLLIGLAPITWVAIPALVVWGVAFGGAPAMLQARMLHTASARIRDVSAAYFTTSFNIAIGGGALLGGIIFDQISITALPIVDVVILAVGIAFIMFSDAWLRKRSQSAHGTSGAR